MVFKSNLKIKEGQVVSTCLSYALFSMDRAWFTALKNLHDFKCVFGINIISIFWRKLGIF
ncbi:MAG: hypothetical protein A3J72_08135 [Nitrospirae bacterium RIFCSPHIGHO2_02_FULL_40_19]|nr:MAG: hypothetical protein A3J72_08135 [Nitrospirae bacterium RIFCSPHIGHO2_02_FULL_40_19]